jgi:hypothetical protein
VLLRAMAISRFRCNNKDALAALAQVQARGRRENNIDVVRQRAGRGVVWLARSRQGIYSGQWAGSPFPASRDAAVGVGERRVKLGPRRNLGCREL